MDPEISNHNMPKFDTMIKIKPKLNKCWNKGSPDLREEALGKVGVGWGFSPLEWQRVGKQGRLPPPQIHANFRGTRNRRAETLKLVFWAWQWGGRTRCSKVNKHTQLICCSDGTNAQRPFRLKTQNTVKMLERKKK